MLFVTFFLEKHSLLSSLLGTLLRPCLDQSKSVTVVRRVWRNGLYLCFFTRTVLARLHFQDCEWFLHLADIVCNVLLTTRAFLRVGGRQNTVEFHFKNNLLFLAQALLPGRYYLLQRNHKEFSWLLYVDKHFFLVKNIESEYFKVRGVERKLRMMRVEVRRG